LRKGGGGWCMSGVYRRSNQCCIHRQNPPAPGRASTTHSIVEHGSRQSTFLPLPRLSCLLKAQLREDGRHIYA
jgi:hypothetical protein